MKVIADRSRGHPNSDEREDPKRYNLKMPHILFDEIEAVANQRGVTVAELIRVFIKLGLIVVDSIDDKHTHLILREGDTEREIIVPV